MKKTTIGDYNYECKNSGLFKIDAFGIPQAIFRLTRDKKISKEKTWDNIPQEHVWKMNRELNQILCRYIHEDESSIEQSIILDEQDSFRRNVLRAIKEQSFLSLDEIGPIAEKLIKAGQDRIEINVKERKFKKRTIERKYDDLIDRCIRKFKEYIPLPKAKGNLDFHEDYFHYAAHFLINLQIERSTDRGHLPVFEKVKTYYIRKNH